MYKKFNVIEPQNFQSHNYTNTYYPTEKKTKSSWVTIEYNDPIIFYIIIDIISFFKAELA